MTQEDAKSIINAYNGGVVPRKDLLANLVVGRGKLLNAIKQILEDTANGGSIMKFLIGDPGFGKTCIMYLTTLSAWAKGFVTMTADFTAERRLYDGGSGKALALYKALMDSVSIKTRPRGGALPVILEVGINNIITGMAVEKGMEKARLMDSENMGLVMDEIDKRLAEVDGIDSADFNSVVKSYFRGFLLKDSILKNDAIKWLSGGFRSLIEARQKLDVRNIVDDSNWYSMLKNFCAFTVHVGHFKGLTILLDEAACICEIVGKDIRDKNIEKVKFLYNDCSLHRCDHMFILMAGTRNFMDNKMRGLCSNEHMRSRLEENEYAKNGMIDYSGPELPLDPLDRDSALLLFERLKPVFDTRYEIDLPLSKENIIVFRNALYKDESRKAFLSPRKVAMKFFDLMETMRQNNKSFSEVFNGFEQ